MNPLSIQMHLRITVSTRDDLEDIYILHCLVLDSDLIRIHYECLYIICYNEATRQGHRVRPLQKGEQDVRRMHDRGMG